MPEVVQSIMNTSVQVVPDLVWNEGGVHKQENWPIGIINVLEPTVCSVPVFVDNT